MNKPMDAPARTDMSPYGDTDAMSPYGDTVDVLLLRARCCRDWPVLALTKMGHCGYCGQVPVMIGPW